MRSTNELSWRENGKRRVKAEEKCGAILEVHPTNKGLLLGNIKSDNFTSSGLTPDRHAGTAEKKDIVNMDGTCRHNIVKRCPIFTEKILRWTGYTGRTPERSERWLSKSFVYSPFLPLA